MTLAILLIVVALDAGLLLYQQYLIWQDNR